MSLVLHSHPLSSYCHKVLIALYELGAPFEARMVDLSDPAGRAAFMAISPWGKMPVLRDDARDRTVFETSIIIEYLDRHYRGPQPLLSDEADRALEVRLWDRVFDLYIHTPMQAAVGDALAGAVEPRPLHAEMLDAAYAQVEQRMTGRAWAAGSDFSLADCAAAPALFYANCVSPFGGRFPAVSAYFERLIARPSVARTLAEARPWLKYFPLRARLEPRFLPA